MNASNQISKFISVPFNGGGKITINGASANYKSLKAISLMPSVQLLLNHKKLILLSTPAYTP
jgi:hypothetical protein